MSANFLKILIVSIFWACTGTPESTEADKKVHTKIEEVQPTLTAELSGAEDLTPETENESMTLVQRSPKAERPTTTIKKPNNPPLIPAEVKVEGSITPVEDEVTPLSEDNFHQHKLWDQLLKKYVSPNGQVDYGSIKKNSALLNEYLEQLNQNSIQSSWTMSQQLAYWINAYNAFTLDLIVRNYPLQSITDLDKPWDTKFIQLGDQHYSLNQIEHEIVRPKFKEPRIHFAFVCAAVSCPKLLNLAYTQENLEKNLDAQTRYFLNESGKNHLTGDPLKISQLFNWYGADFTVGQTLIDFLNKYSGKTISSNVKVEYLEYNWELNE